MANAPPNGFVTIAEAFQSRAKTYSIIGICTDFLPPAQSRGSDWTCKFVLWDPSCDSDPNLGNNGMRIRCFNTEQNLPRIQSTGDILVVRNIITKNVSGSWTGISNRQSSFTVFSPAQLAQDYDVSGDASNIAQQAESQTNSFPSAEFEYAKSLLAMQHLPLIRAPPPTTSLDQSTVGRTHLGTGISRGHKFRLVKDLKDPQSGLGPQFVDLIVEVRRVYYSSHPVEIKVTDYTENSLLYDFTKEGRDGDEFDYQKTKNNFQGPWGQRTITICAWDGFAEHVTQLCSDNMIQVGNILRINNVFVQTQRNDGRLQGHLRSNINGSGTGISFLNVNNPTKIPELDELLERRRDYYREHEPAQEVKDERPNKHQNSDSVDEPGGKQTSSKNAGRRQHKKTGNVQKAQQAQERAAKLAERLQSQKQNPNIRIEKVEVEGITIADILDPSKLPQEKIESETVVTLPFANRKYRSKVQVVDYFPDTLEDFAMPYRITRDHEDADQQEVEDEPLSIDFARNYPSQVKWRWHFFLIVKDPELSKGSQTPMLMLQVAGLGAEYLLNMDPCDLRRKSHELARLKDKLFHLWGELEEKRQERNATGLQLFDEGVAVPSVPFSCLIEEHGLQRLSDGGEVQEDEWERIFSIFGTSV